MMQPIQLYSTPSGPYNYLLLDERAKGLEGYRGIGIINEGEEDEQILFAFEAGSAISQEDVDALLTAPDINDPSTSEVLAAVRATGSDTMAALPGWAMWTAAEAEAYIDANVTDLASAIVVSKALAKAIVALRNDRWPGLQGG